MNEQQIRQELDKIIDKLDEIFSLADWLTEEEHGGLLYDLDMSKHHAEEALAKVDNLILPY